MDGMLDGTQGKDKPMGLEQWCHEEQKVRLLAKVGLRREGS